MPRKGSLRVGVIYKLLDSYLYALSNSKYQEAGVHLFSLGKFLKIQIPPLPIVRPVYYEDLEQWKNYCLHHEPKVMTAMDINLTKFRDYAKPFKMWKKGDAVEDDGGDDDEEGGEDE